MQLDRQPGFEPPVSEITQSKGVPLSKPEDKSPLLETSVEQIFSRREELDDQPPQEILQQLASLEIYQADQEIKQLKELGIKDAEEIYKALDLRGICGSLISYQVSKQPLSFEQSFTLEEKNTLLRQAPAIIDRLHLIEENIPFGFEYLSNYQSILSLTDQEFQEKRQLIQPLFFLDKPSCINFLSKKSNDPKIDSFINYLTSTFINDNNSPDSFHQIKDSVSNILNSETFADSNLSKFIKAVITSDINPNQPIKIPENLTPQGDYHSEGITILNSLTDRQQQKFISENYQKRQSYFKDSGKNKMFDGTTPNINFYRQFIFSEANQGKKITISQKTLDLIDDPQKKFFYQNVSNLKNPDFQMTCLQDGSFNYFDSEGKLTPSFFIHHLNSRKNTFVSDVDISNFSEEEKTTIKLIRNIKGVLDSVEDSGVNKSLRFISNLNQYCDSDGQPNVMFFINAFNYINEITEYQAFLGLLTPDRINSFSNTDKKQWEGIVSVTANITDPNLIKDIFSMVLDENNQEPIFNQDHQPTSLFFEKMILSKIDIGYLNSILSLITPEVLSTFSQKDQELFGFLVELGEKNNLGIINFLFTKREKQDKYIENKSLTNLFYKDIIEENPRLFIRSFNKDDWRRAFGKYTVDYLLNCLPTSTDEKRNAFTHNPYDRTSQFFDFLSDYSLETNFKLDIEHLQVVSEYVKKCGFAKSAQFYNYFQSLCLYQQGKSDILPEELTNNHITSIEDLIRRREVVQKKCFSADPLLDVSGFSLFELILLSTTTGHSSNRWTRIPLETIISDFSKDLSEGKIVQLPPEFFPETITLSQISIETDKQISDSPKLTTLKQEILTSIDFPNDVSLEKSTISELFIQRINHLSQEVQLDPTKPKKQEFIQKQINTFRQKIDDISKLQSVDQLLSDLVTFNLNLGEDQDKFNSVLRQLVFKKVFNKHHDSPGWQEGIVAALRDDVSPVDTVNNMQNLINNTIKDHVLNFETKNQDGYWNESTFETIKKYSAVFKKNLGFSLFINELNAYQKYFVIKDLEQKQTIQMIPDRGLIGEMSGYMANVCYTKVYPLLKTYPDLIPYKFVANSKSESPEFIGSTLVFKVEDSGNQPVFLIRAFDIPNEQSVDIGKFFESFIDHLTPIAKKMGVKKIITAGTPGTISNYSTTNNYVINKYVTGQQNIPLKNTFNFNGYDITNQCYLVRDLS